MKKVLSCSKCSLAFPDLPVVLGFNCPQCGTELEIVRPLTKREAERMRLNLAGQKLAHQNPLKEESEKDFCVEEMMKETIVDQSNMPNETEQKVIDAVIDAQAKSVNLEQQAKTLWELECENCIRKGHSLEDPNPDDKWVPLEYHNADKKEIVELLAEVLNQTCEYEDMMESKVKKLEGQIDLFNTLSGELEEQLKQAKKGLNWHKRKNEDLICDLRVATKFGEHETNENESLKKKVAEANKRLGAIGKILDDVRKSLYFYVNPCATENQSAEEVAQDYMIKHTVKGEEKNYLEQGYLTHKIELELERLRVLTVNEGGKATLSQEQEEGEIMSLFDALREKQSKIVFKGLRCSDGLPCTAYTCTQNWCKFPERKADAKRCLADESKKDASQAVTEAKV